jgi:hypothetical protein
MGRCEQTPGLTTYGHGVLVHLYYEELYWHILSGRPLVREWKLPEWISDPKIWKNLSSPCSLRAYHIFHDCSKFLCRTVDADGKQHFPNHANVSADLFYSITGDARTSNLIRQDMDIHLLKAEGCEEFAKRPQAIDLLITGLSEIHANSKMFGGLQSQGFKIKQKTITQRGKRILSYLE